MSPRAVPAPPTRSSSPSRPRASFSSCPELEFVDGDLTDLGDLPPGLASWNDDPVDPLEASGLRRRARVPLEVEVGLSGDNTFFAGLSMDVADGGLFVATWQALPVGTPVELSFVLPGGHAVNAPGVVVFVIDEREDLPPGMGISLSGLTSQQLDAIRRFCRQRPPTYYDVD